MGSELIVLYFPLALITLGIVLFLIYKPATRWIGIPLLLVSLTGGAWVASTETSLEAQTAFFSTGFVAGCIFAIPIAVLVRWLVRRFTGRATSG